jgi:putative transposase
MQEESPGFSRGECQGEQQNNLPALKTRKPEFAGIYSQVLQDALRRLDKAFANFFHRVAEN